MAVSSYTPVTFTPKEVITVDKMQTFADNVQWLKDNTPRAVYTIETNVGRDKGIVMLSGVAVINQRNSDTATVNVNFGSTFATGCQPVITTGIVNNFQTKVFHRITGRGRLRPDHTGFEIHVEIAATKDKLDKISGNIYVHYTAVGFK